MSHTSATEALVWTIKNLMLQPQTRAQLRQATRLGHNAIDRHIAYLHDQGIVYKKSIASTKGRPVTWAFQPTPFEHEDATSPTGPVPAAPSLLNPDYRKGNTRHDTA